MLTGATILPLFSRPPPPPPPHISLRIKTPEQYEQLKQGAFDDKYKTIFFEPEACPNVVMEAKHFANTTFQELHFTDRPGNVVILFPTTQHLQAYYFAGEGLHFGLPAHYAGYSIVTDVPVNVTDAELDYIVQWKRTQRMHIFDRSDVGYGLLQRIDQLKQMKRLATLTMKVQRKSYKRFTVRPFLTELESLRRATFVAKQLKRSEFKEFVANLPTVDDWTFKVDGRWVFYVKNDF